MRQTLVFGLSVLLIAAALFLTACGGSSTGSNNLATQPAAVTTSTPKNNTSAANTSSTIVSSTSSGAGKPSALQFVTQPGGAKVGRPFTTQPVVAIVDGNGTIIPDYVGNATLRIDSGDADITGTASVIFVKGIATFTDISISKAGTYTLKAITREIQAAVSDSFIVSP
jgi:hypothetical protein